MPGPKRRCILKRVNYTCKCEVYEAVRQCARHRQWGGRCLMLKGKNGIKTPDEIETRETLCPRCQKKAARRSREDAEEFWEKSDRAKAKAGAEVIVIDD